VESKNTDAYIRERGKKNKNERYTINVIYTSSFVEMQYECGRLPTTLIIHTS
jgi:hypothetical protein